MYDFVDVDPAVEARRYEIKIAFRAGRGTPALRAECAILGHVYGSNAPSKADPLGQRGTKYTTCRICGGGSTI